MVSGERRFRRAGVFALLAVALAGVPVARADFITLSGDIEGFLNLVIIPSNGYVRPSAANRTTWRAVINALLDQDYTTAAALADTQFYNLVEFTDTGLSRTYYVLVEQLSVVIQPIRGLGTYVFYPPGRRLLNVQSPHSVIDSNTRAESIAMFVGLRAAFLQFAGTSRCASSTVSACDGTTTTCSPTSQPYRISDVAHNVDTFYQVASDVLAAQATELVSVSVHGFGPCDSADALVTSIAQISNGTSGDVEDSLSTRLAFAYNDILFNLPTPYPGLGGGSCNATASDPPEVQRVGCPVFCGGTNTQGRSINGSPDPCGTRVTNAPLPERFIHLEQQRSLRQPPPGSSYAGVSWQVTIDAFSDVIIQDMWVEFPYSGTERGSFFQPRNTLGEAVGLAAPGRVIRIKAGGSTESLTIDKQVILRSAGGPAVIGSSS